MIPLAGLKKGDRSAIAKAITAIENGSPEARKLSKEIFPGSGGSVIVGITGPGGVGKSSLINAVAGQLKKLRLKPAILAIDPSSHATGGAILGDRARMAELADTGIYIRSIASRGATGAVSRSVRDTIRVLEYARFDPIIIESVGAGQTEVEIANIADITIVVFSPNTGDSIQAIKAGLTEIGDAYIVSKSDLDGSAQLYDAVRDYIGTTEKNPVILKTSIKRPKEIKELATTLKSMILSAKKSKKDRNMERLEHELRDIVLETLRAVHEENLDKNKTYIKYLKKLQSGGIDPLEAGEKITKSMLK